MNYVPSISLAHSYIVPFHSAAAYNIILAVGPSLSFDFRSQAPFTPCSSRTREKLEVQGFWCVISRVITPKVSEV